jgi:hypothetical protein
MLYSFPPGEKHVLVGISHYLPSETGGYTNQYYIGGEIYLQRNGAYTVYGTYGIGWNEGAFMTVFLCRVFDAPPEKAQIFRGRNSDPMPRYHTFSDSGTPQAILGKINEYSGPLNNRVGALFTWSNSESQSDHLLASLSFYPTKPATSRMTKFHPMT